MTARHCTSVLGLDDSCCRIPTDDERTLPGRVPRRARRGPGRGAGAAGVGAGAPSRPAVGRRAAGRAVLAGAGAAPVDDRADAAPTPALLVLWASQTGNAEEFAAHAVAAGRRGLAARCAAWTTPTRRPGRPRREVLVVTSTFGDGGPPDNGADFWAALESARRAPPRRRAVRGARPRRPAPTTTSAATPSARRPARASWAATRMVDRVECEPDDTTLRTLARRWSGCCDPLVAERLRRRRACGAARCRWHRAGRRPVHPAPTRCIAPLVRNAAADAGTGRRRRCAGSGSTLAGTGVELRGRRLPRRICPPTPTRPGRRAGWTATGLDGDEPVDVDGAGRVPLAEALLTRYDISQDHAGPAAVRRRAQPGPAAARRCCAATTRASWPSGCGAGRRRRRRRVRRSRPTPSSGRRC